MRQSYDEYFLSMVGMVAKRATCPRRQVGAIFVDISNRILATGYNGVPAGFPHCTDKPCPGQSECSGTTDRCHAVHAEQNAILQLRGGEPATLYCSATPCFGCARMLVNIPSLNRIVASIVYPDPFAMDLLAWWVEKSAIPGNQPVRKVEVIGETTGFTYALCRAHDGIPIWRVTDLRL